MAKRAAKTRPKRAPRHDWAAAKRRYVTDPTVSLEIIAQDMGADIATVKRHSSDEGWVAARKQAAELALKAATEAVAREQAEFAVAERRAAMKLVSLTASELHRNLISGVLKVGVGDYCAISRNLRELQGTGAAPSSETSGKLILVEREPEKSPEPPTSTSSSKATLNGSSSSNGKANGLPYTPRNGTS